MLVDIPRDVAEAQFEYDPDETQKVQIRSYKTAFKGHLADQAGGGA